MTIYETVISKIISEADRISFGQLKKDAKKLLRSEEYKRRGGSPKLVDANAPSIVVYMIGEGSIDTVCENGKCNKTFGDTQAIPICDNCMIYPNRKIVGWKKDPNGNFVYDSEQDASVSYDFRKIRI
jgi:hypothetical protein